MPHLAETSTGGAVFTRSGQAYSGVLENLPLHVQTPLSLAWLHPGDMNCDGTVDEGDLAPFVTALLDPAGYAAQYPTCEIYNGDMNRDSQVDAGDVQAF